MAFSLIKISADNFTRSVESLLRYLPDRRQKLLGALEAFHITPVQSHRHVSLSDTSSDSLRGIPDAPFSSLTPEQLVLCAQVVDTALFKSYLVVRPGLLGPLCRRDNWCEVAQVEETLAAREVCVLFPSFFFSYKLSFTAFLFRNSRSSLICTMSGRCTLKLWSSFASEDIWFSASDPV
jgi:hypothetical protein